jgi:light-regulated signal transduction histidine kinase (bacteriophytochrome)
MLKKQTKDKPNTQSENNRTSQTSHTLFGRLMKESLIPLNLEVETSYEIGKGPPKLDVLIIRRTGPQWSSAQLDFLPDGIRQSNCKHVILELKYTESINPAAIFQTLGYLGGYVKIKSLKMENVRAFIASSKKPQLKEQFKHHNILLETNFEDDLPEIFVNPQLFEQIIVNLLSNARYAVGKKEETLLCKNDNSSKYQKCVIISLFEESNRFIFLKVSDNGVGMTNQEMKSCMEPFFRTKNVGEGTGLGLSIVRNIVKEFSGNINIESQKNLGTDVIISIPVNLNSGT